MVLHRCQMLAAGDVTPSVQDALIVTSVHLPAAPVAMDWTQAGDGLLVADADGRLIMWQLQLPTAAPKQSRKTSR